MAKRRVVTMVNEVEGDWTGLYLDSKLVWENHELEVGRFLDLLCKHALAGYAPDGSVEFSKKFVVREREANEAEQKVVEATGFMPKTIE